MATDDLHDLTGAYALDALPDDERGAFEAHLPTCPRCADETVLLVETAAALGSLSHEPPPRRLRRHVLAAIEEEPVGTGRCEPAPQQPH